MTLKLQFQKQAPMRTVSYALLPALVAGIYFFGWRTLAIVLVSLFSCILTEWLFVRKKNGKVTEAVLVTALLLGLSMPPLVPLWMVALSGIFGVTFGKMAFGGFGMNVFNPAIVGRAFVYITFPVQLANQWIPAASFGAFPGGFAAWSYSAGAKLTDAITSATPMSAFRDGAVVLPDYWQLFLGNISGQFEKLGEMTLIGGGSVGETSALLLALGGAYLLYKKIANWKPVVSFFGSFLLLQTILHYVSPEKVADPLFGLLSGAMVFAGFYMITDPVSMAKTDVGRWVYGAIAGTMTVVIRSFSLFAGGITFAILLANMFGPIVDYYAKEAKKRKKAAAK